MRSPWHARFVLVAAATLLAACDRSPVATPLVPTSALAPDAATPTTTYDIKDLQDDLGSAGFDGGFGTAFDLNDAGRVAGAATIGGIQHGFVWEHGAVAVVGTPAGTSLNSQAGGRGGLVAVLYEVPTQDPLSEDFCGFHSPLVCSAATWHDGVLAPLPTLGGANAAAFTTNGAGQVVGVAEDGVADNSCMVPQKSHFQGAIWQGGQVQELPPLPGDQVGIALRQNDLGQVVGTSGLCSNTFFGGFGIGPHAVLWDHGTPTYLGDLGDHSVGTAASVNNQGQVVGAVSAPDGTLHPFLWTRATGLQDLGLFGSDAANLPAGINERGQMTGASCDATLTICRGYVWQNHTFRDLNDLIPGDSPLYVIFPMAINTSGQIAGMAVVKATGAVHPFLATPVSTDPSPDIARADARVGTAGGAGASSTSRPRGADRPAPAALAAATTRAIALPQSMRTMLRARLRLQH